MKNKKRTRAGRVTIKDIASKADVSLGTISNVINGNVSVRPATRKRVMEAIRALGYKPSLLARSLRQNRTPMIGMVIPDITNPFFPAVVRGVEDVAFQNSFRLVLCNTDNDSDKEESYLRDLQSYRTAGLILIPSERSKTVPSMYPELRDVPAVCLDRRPEEWMGDSVTVNNTDGVFAATTHLIQLGHRAIAMIVGSLHLRNAVARLEGFRAALRKAKIEVTPEYIQEGRFDRLSGYEKMRILLQQRPQPTAVVCGNDLIALGVLSALREAGLRCPGDVSVVGFDDTEFAELTDPSLTTVFQPGYQMGARGAALLIKRMQSPYQATQHIVLPTELKIRHSVAPPRQAGLKSSRKHALA
ncbi:MAG TPA: LacI family DNA-binding transcriptional regulator [Terriglobales bacterium]|jgi:LacI family transcriptional regulator